MVSGKVALITGGSRGIGRATALLLAKNGADIALIFAGNSEAAQRTADEAAEFGVKAKIYQCDVADFEATKATVDAVISDFGGVDILVNNAGIVRDKLMLAMTEADYDAVVDTNLKGCFNMIKHLYSHMAKRRSGRIINISSVVALMGNPGQANYTAAKAGLIGLTKTVAKELAARGVTCNAIAPGFIRTDMTDALPEKAVENFLGAIPQKRLGEPEDIANAVLFLASDLSGYITGEVIRVDGGLAC